MPDGSEGSTGVVTVRHASVFVVAITDADEVVLVQLDRHTTGPGWRCQLVAPMANSLWSRPARTRGGSRYRARQWREIGRMGALNGICRAPEVVFLATGLSRAGHMAPRRKESAQCAPCPWPGVMEMVPDR